MKRSTVVIALGMALGGSGFAVGHEFWIEPDTFRPSVGSVLRIGLHHGERFAGESVPRNDTVIERFVIVGPSGEHPVVGRSGVNTSFARVETPGSFVIGYQTRAMPHELDARRFEEYLREEGLDRIVDLRAERGESDKPGREAYYRCAKSLIVAGSAGAERIDRLLGHTLELVPERIPAASASTDELYVRTLFRGSLQPGLKVVAVNKKTPGQLLTAVSDAEGRVSFRLPEAGVWMLTTIHMTPASTGIDADWESFWSSLTLEVPSFDTDR